MINQNETINPKKPALIGSFYYFLSLFSAGAYNPFLYVYFQDRGLTGEQVGILASFAPLMTMLLATVVSSVADRKRKRRLITQIALLCTGVIFLILPIPDSFAGIACLMLIFAVFSSPIMALSDSLVARMAQRYNLNYGSMRLWGSFGFGVSALAFGAIWQVVGFRPMFYVAAALYIPLIIVAGKLEETPIVAKSSNVPILNLLRDKGLLILLVATFLSAISNSLSMTFSGIYARSLGAGNFLIGLMIAFGAAAELPTMFFGSRISVHLKKVNTVILSYILMGIAFLGFIFTNNPDLLPVFSIFKGLGYGLWMTTTVRLITERTPEEWASTSQSLLTVCMFGFAPLIAGPLGGWIHDAISPAAVFWLGVITLACAALILGWASLKKKLD